MTKEMKMVLEGLQEIKDEQKAQREEQKAMRAEIDELKAQMVSAPSQSEKKTEKKSTKKQSAPQKKSEEQKTDDKPKTYGEAIAAKYSDEERAAYGKACKEIRDLLSKETITIRGKVYSLFGTEYKKRWNEEMVKRGYKAKYKI